jgi:protein farnesyltransferase subunit beta
MASTPRPEVSASPSSRLEEILDSRPRIEELSDSENEYEDMGVATKEEQANIAYLESIRIPITDELSTATSELQDETLKVVLPYLEGNPNEFPLNSFGLPQLQRVKHASALRQCIKDYSGIFVMLDSSRPWLVYWALQGISALGYDVSNYRER